MGKLSIFDYFGVGPLTILDLIYIINLIGKQTLYNSYFEFNKWF